MAKLTDPLATERPTPRLGGGIQQLRPANLDAEGQGLARAGAEVSAGAEEIFRAQKIEQEKIDTTRVEDAWNQYKNKALDITIGENGLFKKKGADAVNGNILQTLTTQMRDASTTIGGTLSNDEQRQRFTQRVAVTDLHAKQHAMTHLDQEFRAYSKATMEGSEASAKALVSAAPLNPESFNLARGTLMEQADIFLKNQGISDKGAIDKYKSDLTDGLWNARIDSLLYSNPMLAEAVFRANAEQIKNPELKLKLQHRVTEASLGISASVDAQRAIDELRAKAPPPGSLESIKKALETAEGSGPEAVSIQGARGRMQITEDTFNRYKKPGESFSVEADRRAAAYRKIEDDFAHFGGDVRKVAAAYIGGRGAIDAQGNIRDVQDALGTTAKAYAEKVARLVGADPLAQNTSGRPSSRELASQLPYLMAQVPRLATERHGDDPLNPVRAAYVKRLEHEFQTKVSQDVQQQNSLQRAAQGTLIDAITGTSGAALGASGATAVTGRAGAPAPLITSYAQIVSNPELLKAWQLVDPGVKPSLIQLMEKNLHAASEKGDIALYRELFNRIHLDPGDPKKIDFYRQVIDPENVARLSPSQVQSLRAEIDRSETPGGRSLGQMRKAADSMVASYFKTHMMFTAQPERQIEAIMRWNEDVGKKVDAFVAAGQADKVRSMFNIDSPESVVNPKFLNAYVTSTASGASPPVQQAAAPAVQQPANIDTREKLDAWFKTIPPGVDRFLGADGQVRRIPGREPQAAAPNVRTSFAADGPGVPQVMTETGKMVDAPSVRVASDEDVQIEEIKVVTQNTIAERIRERGEQREQARQGRTEQTVRWGELGNLVLVALRYAVPVVPAFESIADFGRAIGRAIPTEPEQVMAAWNDIKRTRVVSQYDIALIERALEYGLPTTKDEALAKKILKKLEGAK